jgi:hypothetical protein
MILQWQPTIEAEGSVRVCRRPQGNERLRHLKRLKKGGVNRAPEDHLGCERHDARQAFQRCTNPTPNRRRIIATKSDQRFRPMNKRRNDSVRIFASDETRSGKPAMLSTWQASRLPPSYL